MQQLEELKQQTVQNSAQQPGVEPQAAVSTVDTDSNVVDAQVLQQQKIRHARLQRRRAKQRARAMRRLGCVALGALVTGFVVAVLMMCLSDGFSRKVKRAFDFRPDLADVALFAPLAACSAREIDAVTVTVQSKTYQGYTEAKTITDTDEITLFLESVLMTKLEGTPSDALGVKKLAEADCYEFAMHDETITIYTAPNDGMVFYIDGVWQAVDPQTAYSFYECYQESAEDAVIYDQNKLVFYPQTWQLVSTETAQPSYGIDVSYHQGIIDWAQVAQDGVDFAMIRVGVRYAQRGHIEEDPLARYNLQEAAKYGIAVGVYFFSTAITQAEALEEAAFTAELISGYPITYPVVYDCEMYQDETNRNYVLSIDERSALAEVFLDEIERLGYTGMFYSSQHELEKNASWNTNWLQSKYRVWVAQYPGHENGATPQGSSNYQGRHEMWQYTAQAAVAGIATSVDRNIAYFSYDVLATPQGDAAQPVVPDYDAYAKLETVSEQVTAKEFVNVRSVMDASSDDTILGTLSNGEVVTRIGVSANGWSKIEFKGGTGYVMTNLITTDITTEPVQPAADADGFITEFTPANEIVTAKEYTNLRNMPSITDPSSQVVAVLVNGDIATRTGVSTEGFSRVEYQGQVLYCVSSYLEIVG